MTDRQAMEQALAALIGLLPVTYTGNPTREQEAAHWAREREQGNGQAVHVLSAYAAIAALRARLDQPMQEGEREAFEEWARTNLLDNRMNEPRPFPADHTWERYEGDHPEAGQYTDWLIEDLWLAWQARAALASQPTHTAQAIHYPECWDTAAYPTLESALSEVYAGFRCTNQDTHPAASQGTAPLEQPQQPQQPDVHSTPCVEEASTARYTWPPKACPCGSGQKIGCQEFGCKWERDPSLVPPHLRSAAGDQWANVQDLPPASERLLQLEALLEKAREAWLPIKTAPRDGRSILLRFGSDGVSQGKYVPGIPHPWKFIDTNDGITWMVNGAVDGPGGPSHWMPMPDAALGKERPQ